MWILQAAWGTKQMFVTNHRPQQVATTSSARQTHLPGGASPHQLVRLPGFPDLPPSSLPPDAQPAASCLQWLPPVTAPALHSHVEVSSVLVYLTTG